MKLTYIYILMALLLILQSCEDFVSVDVPSNQVVTAKVFQSDVTAEAAISGIYSAMISGEHFASGGTQSVSVLAALSADELVGYPVFATYEPFYQNSLDSRDGTVKSGVWEMPYRYIFYANTILEGLSGSEGMSTAKKDQLEGEAKFVRAFCYFYLVNLFGPVPLATTTDYRINNRLSRSDEDDVYALIVSDLLDAKALLPETYALYNNERVRPVKAAASALLARTYLYTEEWDLAVSEATEVIDQSGLFSLTDLDGVFLANSTEAIWQLKPTNFLYTNEGKNAPSIAIASLNMALVDAFETGDDRETNWINSDVSDGETRYYSHKYKADISSTALTEYSMVLRLAEMYLIRAEAKAEDGDVTGSQEDLNVIRNRAGLDDTTADDQDELLDAIDHERQVELFMEWGHRWLDLKRTGDITTVLSAVKGSLWSDNDKLYPIPFTETTINRNLSQNPGYN